MSEEKKAAQAAEETEEIKAEETANVPETEAAEDTAPEVKGEDAQKQELSEFEKPSRHLPRSTTAT